MVIDPSQSPTNATEVSKATTPVPGDLAAWLRGHKRLQVQSEGPTTLGAVAGTRLDFVVSAGYAAEGCERSSCVLLFGAAPHSVIGVYAGDRNQVSVFRIGDQTVLVGMSAPADRFDAFAAEATKVIATLGLGPSFTSS